MPQSWQDSLAAAKASLRKAAGLEAEINADAQAHPYNPTVAAPPTSMRDVTDALVGGASLGMIPAAQMQASKGNWKTAGALGLAGVVPSLLSGPMAALEGGAMSLSGLRKLISPESDESRLGGAVDLGLGALGVGGGMRMMRGAKAGSGAIEGELIDAADSPFPTTRPGAKGLLESQNPVEDFAIPQPASSRPTPQSLNAINGDAQYMGPSSNAGRPQLGPGQPHAVDVSTSTVPDLFEDAQGAFATNPAADDLAGSGDELAQWMSQQGMLGAPQAAPQAMEAALPQSLEAMAPQAAPVRSTLRGRGARKYAKARSQALSDLRTSNPGLNAQEPTDFANGVPTNTDPYRNLNAEAQQPSLALLQQLIRSGAYAR